MKADFEKQIQDIFGTTDIEKLRQISEAAHNYDCMKKEQPAGKHASGRKNSFTEPQIARILALQDQGKNCQHCPGIPGIPPNNLQPDPAGPSFQ